MSNWRNITDRVIYRWLEKQVLGPRETETFETRQIAMVHRSKETTVDEETIENIRQEMYMNCQYTYHVADSDSIDMDSLDFEGIDEYIELDEMGNPVQKPIEPGEPAEADHEPADMPAAEATKEENQ